MCARTLQSPQRAQQVKIRQGIVFGSFFVLAVLLIGGAVSLLRSDILNIAKLDVIGARSINTEQISLEIERFFDENASIFAHERSWVAFSSKGLADYLETTLPVVEDVTVERNGLGSITVTLNERQPYAQMCSVSGNALIVPCFHIDAQGVIFGQITERGSESPRASSTGAMNIEPAHIKVGFSDFVPSLPEDQKPQQFNPHIWEGITNTITIFDSYGLIIDSMLVVSSTTVRIDVGSFVIKAPLFGEFGPAKAAENVAALLIQKFNWHKGMPLPQLDYIDARYGNALFYRTIGGSSYEQSAESL